VGLEPKLLEVRRDRREPVAINGLPFSEREPKPASQAKPVDEIYRKEAVAVRLFVKRMVRNTCDAEDILQETFLRSWPALASGEISCPRAFLFRTARNLALNHIRNMRVRSSDAARLASEEAFRRHAPTAEEQMIASEEATACRRLLDELPQRCREAFVLRMVEDLSYKQMSKSMRLSVSTVEKHIGKGKQICRALLTDPSPADSSLEILSTRMPAAQQAERRQARQALSIAAE
jgi:RNA polymerase sigma-70 factor (ECF subfamily)